MFIVQDHPYECAPVACFNALRNFYPDTPPYVFDDIKRRMACGERITDYGTNMYCLGTFYHREFLVIKELELLGYWSVLDHRVQPKATTPDERFCPKLRRRMIRLLNHPRKTAIVRGSFDYNKWTPPAPAYDFDEKIKKAQALLPSNPTPEMAANNVHSFFVNAIANQVAQCFNAVSGERVSMVPIEALLINGYWILEPGRNARPSSNP